MGQFSVKIYASPGSSLSANQQREKCGVQIWCLLIGSAARLRLFAHLGSADTRSGGETSPSYRPGDSAKNSASRNLPGEH
jgi:hypothetical protein